MVESEAYQSHPFVSVIVPALNCADDVDGFAEAMRTQDYPAARFEVIVVDNGSSDGTLERVRAAGLTGLQRMEKGRTKALNTGIAAAKGEFILTTDLSCIAEPNWIRSIVETFDAYPEAGCVAGDIRLRRTEQNAVLDFQERCNYMSPLLALERRRLPHMPFADGANASFRRTVFDEIGGFEETFMKAGDVEICYRLLVLTKYTIVFNPNALMWEPGEPSLRALLHQRLRMGLGQHLMQMKYPTLYAGTPKAGARVLWWKLNDEARAILRLLKLNLAWLLGGERTTAIDADIRMLMGWAQWYGGIRARSEIAQKGIQPPAIDAEILKRFVEQPDPLAGRIITVPLAVQPA